ncbi:MAG: protease inhibitor I42 family protein [Omnitrophica WOR_2 bacterium]
MKIYKQISFILLVVLAIAACDRLTPKTPKEVSISEQEVQQAVGLDVGDTLEIVLSANPATGYAWETGFYNQSVLKPVGESEYVKQDTNLGAEELQKLHYEAIGEGETELLLVYHRSFEKDAPDLKTFQMNVHVP